MSIEIHVFTNVTLNIKEYSTIQNTIDSFRSKFGEDYKFTIWCDPRPSLVEKPENVNYYFDYLKTTFPNCEINKTLCLADGYKKAVEHSTADYMVMLEHDWIFLDTITHSLAEIIDLMKQENIVHLRFNSGKNELLPLDRPEKFMAEKEISHSTVPYCEVSKLSNNPHIINRILYKNNLLKYIEVIEGATSWGIEDNLKNVTFLKGAIYGPLGLPPTIEHTNGRQGTGVKFNKKKFDKLKRKKYEI